MPNYVVHWTNTTAHKFLGWFQKDLLDWSADLCWRLFRSETSWTVINVKYTAVQTLKRVFATLGKIQRL